MNIEKVNRLLAAVWGSEALASKLGKRPYAGTITAKTGEQRVHSQEKLKKIIRDFGGTGWCCFTDRVTMVKSDDELEGIILFAEIVNVNRSLHVRQSGDGWTLTTFEYEPGGEGIVFDEERAMIPRGTLTYQVLWDLNEDGAFEPKYSRLAKISGVE